MIDSLKELLELGGEWLTRNAQAFFSVVRDPRSFMLSLDFDGNPPILEASMFAVFVSVLNLVIHLPLLRTIGVEAETSSYVLTDTVLTFAFMFVYGSLFHAFAWILRGRGSYLATVVCFLYMTAFFPLLLLVSIPIELFVRRSLIDGASSVSPQMYLEFATEVARSPTLLASVLVTIMAHGYFFFCMVSALRVVHQTGRIRAFLIASWGFGAWIAISTLIELPAFQLFWQASKLRR